MFSSGTSKGRVCLLTAVDVDVFPSLDVFFLDSQDLPSLYINKLVYL